jgi:ABC-type glycerol-3-phosphate transport system substrate-binding protein
MRRFLIVPLSGLVVVLLLLANCAPSQQQSKQSNNTLTAMTNSGIFAGLTKASLKEKSTISSWYKIYHELWKQKFPDLTIKEVKVADDNAEVTKTLLAVNAGNPPDLIGVHGQLPELVKRGAVQNLDKYYEAAGIKPSYFLKPMADYVRYDGHWYGLPGASNPTTGTILYIPKLVKAAGVDPNQMPKTWNDLWTATKKVTKFDAKGNVERIGLPVDTGLTWVNLYCGRQVTYDQASNKFHADDPCVKDYFRFNKRLVDFYGGIQKYTKFISGDTSVWSCNPKAYIPTGKVLFSLDAYWSGAQMDTCYDVEWKLSDPPTPHGQSSEWAALAPVAWVLAVPRGAKNPQLAFDFVKYTIWEHGNLLGPTTNGYVRPDQADAWGTKLIQTQADIRANKHYKGNPMADAMKLVTQGATLGRAIYPKDASAPYFAEQLGRAWEQVAYNKASVDDALAHTQQLVDANQKQNGS